MYYMYYINLLLRRTDSKLMERKANLVNVSIIYAYEESKNVILCDNKDVFDKALYKHDGIHLLPKGISWFARTHKDTIAKALGISIDSKRRTSY